MVIAIGISISLVLPYRLSIMKSISVSREASLALACVIIVNLITFLAFDAQTPLQVVFQVGSIILWYVLSKITALHSIYSKVSKFWYNLRIYIRIILILISIYYMIYNRTIRMLLSGFFSFKGIVFFAHHRVRVKLVSESVERVNSNKHVQRQ